MTMNERELLNQNAEEFVNVVLTLRGVRASFYKLLQTLIESTIAEDGKTLSRETFDAFVFSKGLERLAFEFRLSKPEERIEDGSRQTETKE